MNVLGIDGGMTRLGLGAIEHYPEHMALITHGLIFHPRDTEMGFNDHLNSGIAQIVTQFPRALDLIQPDMIVAETIPAGRLGSNDSLVIAAVTSCKVIAYQFGIEWHDVAANTVKKQIAGDGRATKIQVRNAVFELFPKVEHTHKQTKLEQKELGEKPTGLPQDVFDALAIAVVGARIYANNPKAED